ncbi:MAG: DNA mismatch repair endonuclease MutL [Planctomycetota bacterium]
MIEKTKARIRVLDPHIANKIAAGEVIERPASVVKELVENALDAGAEHIEVFVEEGGSRLLRVVDDGIGMNADDLQLAFVPHATSKLADVEDLECIASLGFRGEALASIGSVAHARIVSRLRGEETGHALENHGGDVRGPHRAGAAPGTEVTVRNLFFNTPARRKFLRTPRTEFGHIEDAIARFALCFPEVGFRLLHDGREILHAPHGQSRTERLQAVLGKELGHSLLPVGANSPGGTLEGYLAPPSISRAHARDLHFFVNGRHIRDKILHRVVRQAYRDCLHHGRYPVVFLFFEIDPAQIDVNVHPTKSEIRWRDSSFLHRVVGPELTRTLRAADLAVGGEPGDHNERVREAVSDYFASSPGPSSQAVWPVQSWPAPAAGRPQVTAGDRIAEAAPGGTTPFSVFQVHDSYLVCEVEDGIAIVDQHALHERVQYDRILSKLTEGGVETQRLLVPEEVELTGTERGLIEEHTDLLKRCGLEWSPFGNSTVVLETMPAVIPRSHGGDLLRDLLELAAVRGEEADARTLFHRVADTMACKAAVRFGDRLSREEAAALLQESGALDRAFVCPHGRPTVLRLPFAQLEKHFGRR